MNAAQRRQRAKLGGLTTAALGHVNVQPSHDAFLRRFADQVDPDGVLAPEERARRALIARRVHMSRLALRSSLARSKKKAGPDRDSGPAVEARHGDAERPTAA